MKQKAVYISPSVIPSTQANSNHVVNICYSLSKIYKNVDLFLYRKFFINKINKKKIGKFYGLNLKKINFFTTNNFFNFFIEFSIFIRFFIYFLFEKKNKHFISRNLYASFFLSLFPKIKLIYETHGIEYGLRGLLQKFIINFLKRKTIVISSELKKIFVSGYNNKLNNVYVLHDAAKSDRKPIDSNKRKIIIQKYFKNIRGTKVGYFGNLYKGRGIKLIQKLAHSNKHINFLIFGKTNKVKNMKNVFYFGFIQPKKIYDLMCSVDILIMPYEKKVSIGLKKIDTSRWMSPLKMFEYMSARKPILSSNHKVLKEVLIHKKNAFIVDDFSIKNWSKSLNSLKKNTKLQKILSKNAYQDYKRNYNWDLRANTMKKIINN